MTLLASFKALLRRYTGEDDVVVGTSASTRTRIELEGVIGSFANNLVLRTDLSGNPTVRDLLERVRGTCLGAYAHQELPFEKLLEELRPSRELSHSPLFQVMFLLHENTSEEHLKLRDVTSSSFPVELDTARFDLTLSVFAGPQGLLATLEYNTDLFDAATMDRMLNHLETMLEAMIADPDRRLTELPLLTADEREQLLVEWSHGPTEPLQDVCVHELFEARAGATPDSTAVISGGRRLTYRELDERSNQLARYLKSRGAEDNARVGICLERSADTVVGVLGIWKAGATYVPLDPDLPRRRLHFVLEDAGLRLVLTEKRLADRLRADGVRLLCHDECQDRISRESRARPASNVAPRDPAYVIYTSGSTGQPKGVEVPHAAVVNFLLSMSRAPGSSPRDVLLAVTTLSFDISVLELFLPLISGGRVVVASREEASDGDRLRRLLERFRVTVMQATPATWQLLLDSGWTGASRLRALCGGEALSKELAGELIDRCESLWNMYGPTETTVWSAIRRIESRDDPITIGRPIANTEVYILDAFMEPVPIGVPGELHLGGRGLARGYVDRPELTNERFVPHPFSADPDARLYKTGDLARYRSDGEIEFLGRLDHQVKIRSFRVELGDIESVLETHEGIQRAAVLARENDRRERELVAYMVPEANSGLTLSKLRRFVAERLPDYMVPVEYHALEEFPLTPGGKVDRKALPELEQSRRLRLVAETSFTPARDELERQLVTLWEEVLEKHPIGIRDDFFEIGGHSLKAARLFFNIRRRIGIALPLALLFQAPTIEQLAACIREDRTAASWTSLVPIQPRGARPPLFCIHGAGGNVLIYGSLASYLGPEQPVYGLQARGLDGREAPLTRFEDMAAHYIREIKSVQPSGPYFLGGYCLGGAIAYEMAQQLREQGEAVGLLVLFETYNLRAITAKWTLARRVYALLQNIRFHVANLLLLGSKDKLTFLREKAKVARRRMLRILGAGRSGRHPSPGGRRGKHMPHVRLARINDRANIRYEPKPYHGRVALFRPGASFADQDDPTFGWGDLVSGTIETIVLPVYPRAMLVEPFVKNLAERLRSCLARDSGSLDHDGGSVRVGLRTRGREIRTE